MTRLVAPESVKRLRVIDDEETFRYALRHHSMTPRHRILEAANGGEAIRVTRSRRKLGADIRSKEAALARESALPAIDPAMRLAGRAA